MFDRLGVRVLLVVAMLGVAAPNLALACERPADAANWEKALFNWVNSERKALGLAPFRQSSKLKKSASSHACDMAEHGYFAHSRSGGPDLRGRLAAVGYKPSAASENLAYTRQPDPGTVAEIWRNSSVHWGSMTSGKYVEAGISIASGGGKIYWVMNMGKSK